MHCQNWTAITTPSPLTFVEPEWTEAIIEFFDICASSRILEKEHAPLLSMYLIVMLKYSKPQDLKISQLAAFVMRVYVCGWLYRGGGGGQVNTREVNTEARCS